MMCDELTLYYSKSLNLPIYVASEVDAAIDELKTEHHKERDEYISMVYSREQTIKELKAKLDEKESWVKMLGEGEVALSLELEKTKQKLENVQASMYCDVVDANMENRKLRRELWIARAKRALEKIAWFKLWNTGISTMNPEDGARQEYDKWKKSLGKFLKKAEQYK